MRNPFVHWTCRDLTGVGRVSGRLLVAIAMLIGTMTVGLRAAGAQADEGAGTYESPTFGYTLEWDADLWTVESDTEASADYPRDLLGLSDVDGTTVLFAEASDQDWSSTDECVSNLFADIDLDPADGQVIEDANGQAFEVSDGDRSLAAYVFPIDLDNGETQDQVRLVECRSDPDSDLIVGFTVYSGIVDEYPEIGYPLVSDITDSLTFAGGGRNGGATPRASADEATPEASAGDDATPEASADDATPEASDQPSGNTGVDGNAYVSPTYGYELSWDEDVWTVEDESSADGVDALTLSSNLLVANVTGYNSGDGDIQTCLDNVVTVLDDRGDGNATIATDPDTGDDLVFPNDDQTQLEALVIYSVDGEDYASRVTCVSLDDENVLAVEFAAPGADVVSDDASTQISDLLDTIVF